MNKIIGFELKKLVSKPGIYILAVLLAVLLCVSAFIYNPKEKEVEYKGFDLYWDSDDYSNIHKSTLIVCANLLCVIKEDETVQKIINVILANNKPFIIQVYEGDKSGKGKQTGNDQYQRNLRTKDYLNYFDWKGIDVIVYKGCIIRKRDKHLLQTKKSLV